MFRRMIGGAAAGALTWTLTEYSVHRWAMHGRGGTNAWSEEHLDHHAKPYRTFELKFDGEAWMKVAGVPAVGLPAAGIGALIGGRRAALQIGLAAGLAFSACYATYTHVHHIIHHEPPATSAGRWVRKHHLAHHFSTPKRNFGVTHGWWDVALGTAKTPDQLKVPRRLAPSWLVDETGGLRAEHAADYVLAGRTTRAVADADVDRAMADQAPVTD